MVASKQLRLAVAIEKKKEEQDWRMMQLPNGSVGQGDGGRKKSKTGEDGSYHTAHVSLD